MKSKMIRSIAGNALAWIVSFICLAPLLLIAFNSLKTKLDASAMNLAPPAWPLQFDNYRVVIEKGKLFTSFLNSLLYSTASVALSTLLSAMAAYVLSRNRTRGHRLIYLFLILGITMPVNYVALTKVMLTLGLMNSRLGVVLFYAATQISFSVFIIYGFVGRLPVDLDEAAIIDGCGPFQLFFRIVLPLLKPAVTTVIVLSFLNTWNDFISPLYFLGSSTKWPMTLSVYNFFGMYFKDWNLVCADIVMTSLPVLLVYLLGQKYIVSGIMAGAVKG